MKLNYKPKKFKNLQFNNKFLFLIFFSFIFLTISSCRSEDKLSSSINLSAEYIDNFSKSNGMFDYEVNMLNGRVSDRNYNMLRHSGTIYALANYYLENRNSKSLKTLEQATQYLKSCCIKPVDNLKDILGVWSLKSINKSMNIDQLKLGGTGLGLVALLSMEKVKPGTTDADTLRKLGNFINLFAEKTRGIFIQNIYPQESVETTAGPHFIIRAKLHSDL